MKKLLIAAVLFVLGLTAKPAAAYPAFGTVQISTNTTYAPTLQSGAIKIASGTINALVVSTLTVNGNAVVTGTTTSGAFSGSGASLTNIPAANITGTIPGIILLQATLQAGSTFFVSTGTVNNLNVSTLTVVGNQGYTLFYSSMVCIVPSQSTTKSTYVVAVATITITPKRTTSRIKVVGHAGMRTGDSAQAGVVETLFRGATNLASAYGSANTNLCEYRPVTPTSTTSYAPCHMEIWDLPATTSALTYTIGIANTDNTTSCSANQVAQTVCMSVEEWGF